jgi:predicted nuclease of predicted toxin-antitoxin system
VRILIDHNLDWRLKNYLPGHEVKTVFEMGWSDLLNGELMDEAIQAQFDVLLTSDSSIRHQQNFSFRLIAVVVLRARDNRLKTHIPMMQDVLQTLLIIRPGEVVEVPERLKTR